MQTFVIHESHEFKEKPLARFLITHCLENEYQFEIEIPLTEEKALIAFHKGNLMFQVLAVNSNEIITVSDSPEVLRKESSPTLAEAFVEQRIQAHEAKINRRSTIWGESFAIRETPAKAAYDYLNLRLRLDERKTIKINILQPGRNGWLDEQGITLSRKDW